MTFKCKTIKTNFHMHTTFADGKNTVEEMILAAIDNGGEAVGFSEHGYTPIDHSWCMMPEATDRYIENVNLYKEKYPLIKDSAIISVSPFTVFPPL